MATKVRPLPSPPEIPDPRPDAEVSSAEPTKQSRWWLRHADQVVLAGATSVALVLLALYWLDMSEWGRQPFEIDRLPKHALDFRVAPNQASWVEWAQLPGLGQILAKRIVEDCNQNGRRFVLPTT